MTNRMYCKHHPEDPNLAALCMKLRAHDDEETWPKVPKTHRMVEDLIRELREHPNVKSFELTIKF